MSRYRLLVRVMLHWRFEGRSFFVSRLQSMVGMDPGNEGYTPDKLEISLGHRHECVCTSATSWVLLGSCFFDLVLSYLAVLCVQINYFHSVQIYIYSQGCLS
jgi:hypothetical protein